MWEFKVPVVPAASLSFSSTSSVLACHNTHVYMYSRCTHMWSVRGMQEQFEMLLVCTVQRTIRR